MEHQEPHAGSSTPGRFAEIDALKAVGILVVILIHSLRAPWDPRISSFELWLGIVTRFAVPSFLFCSGFLYATTTAIPMGKVLRRLRRVLVPYVICSVAAQLWWVSTGQGHATLDAALEMLLGSSFGPYYYVFVHFFLVLVAPLFALVPYAGLVALTVVLIGCQAWLESSMTLVLPIFWHIRNPLLWWGYFLLGWIVRQHHASIAAWTTRHRAPLIAGIVLSIVGLTWAAHLEGRNEWVRAAMWLDIYAISALVFVTACGRRHVPPALAHLSDTSFAIYLLHLFFVYGAERLVTPAVGQFDALVIAGYWAAGLLGSLALIAAARRIFGRLSRDIIGA